MPVLNLLYFCSENIGLKKLENKTSNYKKKNKKKRNLDHQWQNEMTNIFISKL